MSPEFLRLLVLWAGWSLMACSLVTPDSVQDGAPRLRIELSMKTNRLNGEAHPVAHVVVTNVADSSSAAFSKTFGTTDGNWLSFRIEEVSEGRLVPYPIDVDLFEEPEYSCLTPGESVTLQIDLLNWKVLIGGRVDGDEPLGFELPPGDYKVQAVYREPGARRRRCPAIQGEVKSSWREFSVPPQSPQS